MVVSEARKYLEASFEKLTPAKAQEMARSIAHGGGKEQVSKLAHELMDWSAKSRARLREVIEHEIGDQLKSNKHRIGEFIDREVKEQFRKNRERLTELVQREVQKQVKALGLASKADVDALKRRVRDLERAGAPARRTAAKKATPKKTAAKKTAVS